MKKTSPFSRTTKQLRDHLSAAMIKAVHPGREASQPDGDAGNPDMGELDTPQKCSGEDGG